MQWFLGLVVLTAFGLLLRRALRMDAGGPRAVDRRPRLRPELEAMYQPVAHELETQAAILGITLNDAFSERKARRLEMAWHVVQLALGEWERLAELAAGLQSALARFLPSTQGVVVARRIAVGLFKSRIVMDNVALYEFLDQILFSSKRRFALQLRLLFRTSALLSKEFRRTCREGERSLDCTDELWTRLDHYFHDFDLILKETLLAFRTLLVCQKLEDAQELAMQVQELLERGTRASIPATNP